MIDGQKHLQDRGLSEILWNGKGQASWTEMARLVSTTRIFVELWLREDPESRKHSPSWVPNSCCMVSMFLEGNVFMYLFSLPVFKLQEKNQCPVGVLVVLFPGLIWLRTFIYWKGSKIRNVKHLDFCQGQQLSWSHIICSTCVSAPLAKIRFMSQLIHPQMRISRSSAFP